MVLKIKRPLFTFTVKSAPMRVRKCQCLVVCALLVNILALYYFWKLQSSLDKYHMDLDHLPGNEENVLRTNILNSNEHSFIHPLDTSVSSDRHLHELITVVIREFEDFDNDIEVTVNNLLLSLPHVKIVIIADKTPYPPLKLSKSSDVKLVVLQQLPERSFTMVRPEYHIRTPYILFVPDSVRIYRSSHIKKMLQLSQYQSEAIVVAKISGEKSICYHANVSNREWTLKNSVQERNTKPCTAVSGRQVILVETKNLLNLSHPFARPFPHAFYVQSALREWKINVMDQQIEFQPGKALFTDSHLKWKINSFQAKRLRLLYEAFGIKKVMHINGKTEWHGCSKHTPRCFGSVIDDMPEYLFEHRWTPPCCLEALRKTARHVLRVLKQTNVRHWLEGGSLLGAARNGDIIPWDYDVDIGVYKDDVTKCPFLVKALQKATEDDDGFVWEKATEGDFFRVQYSKTNHMHVDIFPFYSKNGVMTKNMWFKTHRQDREFPESFLRPTTTINFVGIQASAPNNIRDFLELKFGEGAIETPQYPNPTKLKFPNNTIYF